MKKVMWSSLAVGMLILVLFMASCSKPAPESSVILYHTDWVKNVAGKQKIDVEELWQIAPEGSVPTRIAATGWYGEYSPDNSLIAYSEPYDNGIWVMSADSPDPVQLTSFGSAPAWSPDGKRLAFHGGGTEGTKRHIWIMNSDGTNAHQLSTVNGSSPNWSPDGTQIIFHGEVNNGIWLINPDGSGETMLYRYGGYPAWSPDGEIAYVDLFDWCIWIMDTDGENKRKLTDHKGIFPAWSADGLQIAYEGLEKNKRGIWVINMDGTDDHMLNEEGRHPDWSN